MGAQIDLFDEGSWDAPRDDSAFQSAAKEEKILLAPSARTQKTSRSSRPASAAVETGVVKPDAFEPDDLKSTASKSAATRAATRSVVESLLFPVVQEYSAKDLSLSKSQTGTSTKDQAEPFEHETSLEHFSPYVSTEEDYEDGYEEVLEEHVDLSEFQLAEPFMNDRFSVNDSFASKKFSFLEEALSSLEEDQRTASLISHLNDAQKEAVKELVGPVLVVAGPGSGKTRVLTHRMAALVALGVPPWQIMAVTFTNKAAGEMRERISSMIGEEEAREMWVSTFHSMCARILRQYHEEAGLPRAFSILDSADSQKVIKSLLGEIGAPNDAQIVKELQSAISKAKNSGRSVADLYASIKPSDQADARLMQLYNDRLQQNGSVDFDDLLCLTVHVLATSQKALDWVRKRSRFLLVDEVQDTNAVQVALLRLISPPTTFEESEDLDTGVQTEKTVSEFLQEAKGNICVVGDADQSIYAWRSADPVALFAFMDEFPHRKVVVLEQNYRSTKAILETVQAIIDPNPAVKRPRLFTENERGKPVRLYVAQDDRDEAAWVVSEVLKTTDPLDSHAVLFRTNAQTRVFEEKLSLAGVPYQVIGALKFYDRAEIKDALSYLRFVVNPFDAVNFTRCLNTPKRGLGDKALAEVLDYARSKNIDIMTALEEGLYDKKFGNRYVKSLEVFLSVCHLLVKACQNGPAYALRVVADEVGLREHLRADKEHGLDRLENLDQLVTSAESFLKDFSPSGSQNVLVKDLSGWDQTVSFLENVALTSAVDEDSEKAVSKLSLMTAHASKGKEFPHVFVVGVEDGLYPHERVKGDEVFTQEERRLLFVAASRAESTLTLSRSKRRFFFNEEKTNPASPFLADLPSSVETIISKKPLAARNFPARGSAVKNSSGYNSSLKKPTQFTSFGKKPVPTPLGPKKEVVVGPRLLVEDVSTGMQVSHTLFGTGEIEAVEGNKVTVLFAEKGRKTLDLSFAPLTAI